MKAKKYARVLLAACLAGSFLVAAPASAEIKTYEGVGEYVMSDFETPDVAKQRAKVRAEQDAQERAGVFVNSYTRVENLQVTEDEVIAITSGIMSIIDTSYERVVEGDGELFRARIKANIDTDKIGRWLEKGVQERSALAAQNKELQAAIEEQNRQIAELKKQLTSKGGHAAESSQLKAEFAAADNAFLANQKIEAGNRLYAGGNWQGAIASYSEAIALNPRSDIAYRNRGTSYANLANYNQSAQDFSQAISLSPRNAAAYVGRGAAYICLQDYSRAASDLTRAIELSPNDGMAYYNRGICYQAMGDRARAQADFARARALGVS